MTLPIWVQKIKNQMKTRTDLLNLICEIRKPQRYLEIGIKDGVNFKAINCPVKVGVDPNPECDFEIEWRFTSDEFFRFYDGPKFDLIFIDGDHSAKQVDQDIHNAIGILNEGGLIVCHDSLPHNIEYTRKEWCGTSYIAVANWAQCGVFDFCTFEADHGCTIFSIKRENEPSKRLNIIDVTFENLWRNDAEIVNKSTWEEVEKWLKELK